MAFHFLMPATKLHIDLERENSAKKYLFFCHIILYLQGDDNKDHVLPKRAKNTKWQLKTISAAIVSFGLGLISTDKGFTTQLSSLFQLKGETTVQAHFYLCHQQVMLTMTDIFYGSPPTPSDIISTYIFFWMT